MVIEPPIISLCKHSLNAIISSVKRKNGPTKEGLHELLMKRIAYNDIKKDQEFLPKTVVIFLNKIFYVKISGKVAPLGRRKLIKFPIIIAVIDNLDEPAG